MRDDPEAQKLAELAAANPDDTLLNFMIGFRRDLKAERSKRRRDRVLFGLVVVLAVVFWTVHSNAISRIERNTAADQADRAERRVAACQKDNENAAKVNNQAYTLVDLSTRGQTPSADKQAAIDEYLARVIIPPRDCTPAAIDAYLSTTTTTAPPGG